MKFANLMVTKTHVCALPANNNNNNKKKLSYVAFAMCRNLKSTRNLDVATVIKTHLCDNKQQQKTLLN